MCVGEHSNSVTAPVTRGDICVYSRVTTITSKRFPEWKIKTFSTTSPVVGNIWRGGFNLYGRRANIGRDAGVRPRGLLRPTGNGTRLHVCIFYVVGLAGTDRKYEIGKLVKSTSPAGGKTKTPWKGWPRLGPVRFPGRTERVGACRWETRSKTTRWNKCTVHVCTSNLTVFD